MLCLPLLLCCIGGSDRDMTLKTDLAIGALISVIIILAVLSHPAQAAVMQLTTQGTASLGLVASSDLQWAASSGDMSDAGNLSPAQETLTGAYSGFALTTGESMVQSARTLDQTSLIEFQAEQHVKSAGPGSTGESYALFSVGAPGEATCDNTTTIFVPYCEAVIASSLIQGSNLAYDGMGVISQADDVIPDSFNVMMQATGDGMGSLSFGTITKAGIDNTTALGYTNHASQSITGFGEFRVEQSIAWTSFKSTFDQGLANVTAEAPAA